MRVLGTRGQGSIPCTPTIRKTAIMAVFLIVGVSEPTAWLASGNRKGFPLFAESKSETCTDPVRVDKRTRGPPKPPNSPRNLP